MRYLQTLGLIILSAILPGQVGWTQDADMGRTLGNGVMWCDTSVVPNEVYAFGGSENTLAVSRYHKDGSTWKWEMTNHQSPGVMSGPLGMINEWAGGRAEFLERDSQGRAVLKAICISGTLMQFGGLGGNIHSKVWTFDRSSGFAPVVEKPLQGPRPPHDRDFTTCVVPWDPSNPAGSGRIYRFGTYSGPIASATNDMWVLDRTAPGEITWTKLKAMGGSPPPPLAHATLTYAQGLLILSGGMRYELGAPISSDMWIGLPFPISGRQLWIRLPRHSSGGIKWKGCVWFQTGAFFRIGATGRYDRPSHDTMQVLPFGWLNWWTVPQQYARPPSRWMCSGCWIESEQCYMLAGGIRVPGLNGGVDLYTDSWRFRL
ncbi:MAG: hypothetical protein GY701_28925 [Sulfitobacter sp.]|nr:hypothetical protein [Sulfitobacter sp.]